MKALFKNYGKLLTGVFFGSVVFWAALLIILPQATMLKKAITEPKRQLDSSIAEALARDSDTCANVLLTYARAENRTGKVGAGIPSFSGTPSLAVPSMSSPSASGMAIPSMGGGGSHLPQVPYIIQCDRADTHRQMVRSSGERIWLDELYNVPTMKVPENGSAQDRIKVAHAINEIASTLHKELLERERTQLNVSWGNFSSLMRPTLIPLSSEQKLEEDGKLSKMLYGAVGLRMEKDGQVYERLGLIVVVRTLTFAILATALALVVCYPVAYNLALASSADKALWLFLGLIIPYAIVELMRIYAWTSIIDSYGLLNTMLDWVGITDLARGEVVHFKRSALTVFLVIVYTYVLFMVFPIYNVMSTLDKNQVEAAKDLGASSVRVHWRVIIPHSKPGIAVGCIATFMLAAGAFSVPRIISRGLQSEWFSQTIYNKFFEAENSNIGAAYSVTYTVLCFALVALFMWLMRTRLKDFARAQ
ncbi:ABC transporter permease [Flexibacterium corallicola]|uniref:ABC transporter permease n=1 Tax=Flexibacterium corallicola TaxID=3037259 RepID=UPI00286EB5A1|nr:ABC transporter permease [Pseudovibrio sp. M1P-2-3]